MGREERETDRQTEREGMVGMEERERQTEREGVVGRDERVWGVDSPLLGMESLCSAAVTPFTSVELLLLTGDGTDDVTHDDDVTDDEAKREPLAAKPSALTGGAFKTPTPLPSVTNDT